MPRRDFAQKAISRGGILVARAYTYIENEKYLQFLTVEIYSQTYAIKIVDLPDQGPHRIVG